MSYDKFLHTKIETAPVSGFEVRTAKLTDMETISLFDLMEQEVD